MSFDQRYARQLSVLGGVKQRAIARMDVEVVGAGLDAQVCALYLAGAGVRRLWVDPSLRARCQAQNSLVEVSSEAPRTAEVLVVRPEDRSSGRCLDEAEDAVMRGARAARWALAKAFGG